MQNESMKNQRVFIGISKYTTDATKARVEKWYG